MPDDGNHDQAYEHARKRVEELRGLYSHLLVYFAVNLGLFALNMLTNRHTLWFLWPLIVWGSCVLIHGAMVLLEAPFSKKWELVHGCLGKLTTAYFPRRRVPGATGS